MPTLGEISVGDRALCCRFFDKLFCWWHLTIMGYYFSLALTIFIYMNCWFLWSLIRKRNDVVDVAWGLGFVLLSWLSLLVFGNPSSRGFITVLLINIWGIRLSLHVYLRNLYKVEDFRYLAWRKAWGRWFYIRSYLLIYLLQGLLLFVIAWPVMHINKNATPGLTILDYVGILVWISGLLFESISDAQLARFTKDPNNKGKILDSGLWQYSRHPNYFGEVTQWWGIWLIALSVPYGWLTVLSPITITLLILFVSGVPLLEAKMAKNEAYAEYKRRVRMFLPLPKKSNIKF